MIVTYLCVVLLLKVTDCTVTELCVIVIVQQGKLKSSGFESSTAISCCCL